mgnify:CR=1 FL=1
MIILLLDIYRYSTIHRLRLFYQKIKEMIKGNSSAMSLSSQTIIYPNKSDATYFLVGLFQGWMLDSRLIQGNAQVGLN